MGSTAQARAVDNYRRRLSKRGMVRFEVLGLKKDRELVRALASKLAEKTAEADEMRASMHQSISAKKNRKGGLLEVLRTWPLAELDLKRPFETGRKIDL